MSNDHLPAEEVISAAHRGEGTYRLKVACTNCDWAGTLEMPQGYKFTSRAKTCPRCQCFALTKVIP